MSVWLQFTGLTFPVGVENRRVTCSGTVGRGGVLVIRGPSGTGKTTLLRVLARLQPATGGDVWLDGRHWRTFAPGAWRAAVCYVAQQPVVFEGSVCENLRRPFQLAAVGKRLRYREDLVVKGMDVLRLPPALLEQDARLLSGGEAARMAVLRALMVDPAVLLLDEPTAALDRSAAAGFCELINQWLAARPERAALIVSHDDFVSNHLQNPVFLDLGGAGGLPGSGPAAAMDGTEAVT